MIEVTYFNVGCGDGIHVRFRGDDGTMRNILIDGGTESRAVYASGLRRALLRIIENAERIDLWVISHIDDDHIGGILEFTDDVEVFSSIDLSKTVFWYNYSDWDFEVPSSQSTLKGVPQGIRLRDFLTSRSKLSQFVSDEMGTINFHGADLTILSPSAVDFKKLMNVWKKEEVKIWKKKTSIQASSKKPDHNLKLQDFDLTSFKEDDSPLNRSSIAFLMSFKGRRFLFTADSRPSVVSSNLIMLGFVPFVNRLKLDFMQVPHHGSKFNTNGDLLSLIKCTNFIVTGDGFNAHNLPNKETLARIVRSYPDEKVTFYFTELNSVTSNIFRVDDKESIPVSMFPKDGESSLFFSFV